jgi:hypothetical protein
MVSSLTDRDPLRRMDGLARNRQSSGDQIFFSLRAGRPLSVADVSKHEALVYRNNGKPYPWTLGKGTEQSRLN